MSDTNDWIPTHFAGSPAFDNQPAAPREVSGEAAPPKDFAAELQESSMRQWFDAHPATRTIDPDTLKRSLTDARLFGRLPAIAAAPTPHSDSLEALLNDYANAVAEHAIHEGSHSAERKVRLTRAALLSCLETLTRERDEAQEKFRRLGEAYNFLYHEHGALSGKFLRLESENARMAEVVEAAGEMSDAMGDIPWDCAAMMNIGTDIVKAYRKYNAARAASPDANPESHNG